MRSRVTENCWPTSSSVWSVFIADAEAHAQHALLARRERGKHPRRGLAQVRLDRRVDGQDRVLVLDEIAEMAVFLVADRRLKADRLLSRS